VFAVLYYYSLSSVLMIITTLVELKIQAAIAVAVPICVLVANSTVVVTVNRAFVRK